MVEKKDLTSTEWRAYGVLVKGAEKRNLDQYDLDKALRLLNDFVEMLEG